MLCYLLWSWLLRLSESSCFVGFVMFVVLLFVVVLLEAFVVFLDGEPCCAFPLEW